MLVSYVHNLTLVKKMKFLRIQFYVIEDGLGGMRELGIHTGSLGGYMKRRRNYIEGRW